eukprot:CAMPEP_0181271424 /NCGR_PEP_ID=MMETSP1097-20121128/7387_1 /TAXON_ID=35684 /ORGANISM="Pseudopedinella elastica, Strain CCMP716" /LENGTH=34 /DNA_ID= /DNA_START= /DNA_END= /DNA_ORIENTATION=
MASALPIAIMLGRAARSSASSLRNVSPSGSTSSR